MNEKRGITQADVAAAAGVSSYTVSCALRGQAQVSAATRERIVALAESMGYRANAAASLLAGQRHDPVGHGRKLQLGWFGMNHDDEWRAGFLRGCEALGYGMEVIDCRDFRNGRELTRAMWQRGVQGVVFHSGMGTLPREMLEAVDWNRFSVVKLSRAWPESRFHLIRHSAFDYMRRALQEVMAKGYRRIAVLMLESESEEDDDARLGALLSLRARRLPKGVTLEWRGMQGVLEEENPEKYHTFIDWIRDIQADAVLGFPWGWKNILEHFGLKCPEDIAFASLIAPDRIAGHPEIAGCLRKAESISHRAVEELHRLITLGERGMTRHPMEHVVEPEWHDAATLPPCMERLVGEGGWGMGTR